MYALVAGLPEHKIQIIAPDIGGGFGNKVGIYPGYVCAVVGSIVKAPGGVAYACSFRITEAVYLIERLVDVLALDQGWDPAQLRRDNLLRSEQFPYTTALGWEYDSGDYPKTLATALEIAGWR